MIVYALIATHSKLNKDGYLIQPNLESAGALGNKGRADFADTVGKREFEVGCQKLFDVRATDISSLLNLNDAEDLWRERI